MMAPHPESVKGRARVMRQEGASIRMIAATLGVSKSAVGKWLLDTAPEPQYVKTCWCGERFLTSRSHAMSCSRDHSSKRYRTFGPLRSEAA